MDSKLFISLVLNVGVLLIISGILADIKYVRVLLLQKDEKIQNKIVLGVMFGIMSIVSTYLGLGVQGAIVNTRVIGVLASGILGGPVVGIITAVIAGTHRYFYDVGGFTSFACSVSTIVEGLIGAAAYKYYQNKKMNPFSIGIIAVFAEITQMVIILILAKPFSDALALVKMITEGIIALIWAAAAMTFFGGLEGLAAESGKAAVIVNKISEGLMGKTGMILAILGVVACPITSGDTAFRSIRLTLADTFKINQKTNKNRFVVVIPVFIVAVLLMFIDFNIIWRYFAWSNQTLASIILWTAAVYLKKNNKFYWIALLPAMFMTVVVSCYILVAPEGFYGLITQYMDIKTAETTGTIVGIILAFILAGVFFLRTKTNVATKGEQLRDSAVAGS